MLLDIYFFNHVFFSVPEESASACIILYNLALAGVKESPRAAIDSVLYLFL